MNQRRQIAHLAYRDAVGILLAARRKDEDAMEWLGTFQPSMKANAFNGLLAMATELMREIDRLGGNADDLVRRWALNIAEVEARRLNGEKD